MSNLLVVFKKIMSKTIAIDLKRVVLPQAVSYETILLGLLLLGLLLGAFAGGLFR